MNSQGITPDTCDAFFLVETLHIYLRIQYLLCPVYLLYLMVPLNKAISDEKL
jgi:hypothetical protein